MEKERVCADGPAISRRTLLATMPMAGAALALPASASDEDPILSHYRNWLAARQEWLDLAELPGNGNFDSPASKAVEKRDFASQERMAAITPTSSAGIAALLHLYWVEYGPYGTPGSEKLIEQCEERPHKLILEIWRGVTGGDDTSYPDQIHAKTE